MEMGFGISLPSSSVVIVKRAQCVDADADEEVDVVGGNGSSHHITQRSFLEDPWLGMPCQSASSGRSWPVVVVVVVIANLLSI